MPCSSQIISKILPEIHIMGKCELLKSIIHSQIHVIYFSVESTQDSSFRSLCVLCCKGKRYRFFCEMEQKNHDNFDFDVYISCLTPKLEQYANILLIYLTTKEMQKIVTFKLIENKIC